MKGQGQLHSSAIPYCLKLQDLWQLTELHTSEPSIHWTRQHTLTHKTAERLSNSYNQIFPQCMNHPTKGNYAAPSGPCSEWRTLRTSIEGLSSPVHEERTRDKPAKLFAVYVVEGKPRASPVT